MRFLVLDNSTTHDIQTRRNRGIDRIRQAAIACECSGNTTLAAHYTNIANMAEARLVHELAFVGTNNELEVM